MTTPLVVVEQLTKSFAHEGAVVSVLKGIDLEIDEGEMLSIVGQSGAGKSTLLHLLGTLDLPTSGRILYNRLDVTRYGSGALAAFRNQTIGFVFQFHHLLPEFTALENVMMPGLIRGQARQKLTDRATSLLDEVGLSHRLSHRPGELSGGEQQRVALARALVMEPKLVLADEPTGNLDSKTSDSIHKLFFELNEQRGTTFLIVTHSRDLAERMPRIVTMRDGRIHTDERRAPRGAYRTGGRRDADADADPARAFSEEPAPQPHGETVDTPEAAASAPQASAISEGRDQPSSAEDGSAAEADEEGAPTEDPDHADRPPA